MYDKYLVNILSGDMSEFLSSCRSHVQFRNFGNFIIIISSDIIASKLAAYGGDVDINNIPRYIHRVENRMWEDGK